MKIDPKLKPHWQRRMSVGADLTWSHRNILKYDTGRLLSWGYLMVLSGTAITPQSLLGTGIMCSIATVLGFFRCPKGAQLSWDSTCVPMIGEEALMLSSLVAFLLGMFGSLTFARWWSTREKLQMVMGRSNNMAVMIATYVIGDDEGTIQAREDMCRYMNLAHALVYKQADNSDELGDLVAKRLLTVDELESIQNMPSRYIIVYTWLSALLREVATNGRLVFPEFVLPLMHAEISLMRGGAADIFMFLNSQIPYAYVHLLTLVTKIHVAFVLGYSSGLIGQGFEERSLQMIIFAYIYLFATRVIYEGLLQIHHVLVNPFGEDPDDFPKDSYMESLLHTTKATLRQAGRTPCEDYFSKFEEPLNEELAQKVVNIFSAKIRNRAKTANANSTTTSENKDATPNVASSDTVENNQTTPFDDPNSQNPLKHRQSLTAELTRPISAAGRNIVPSPRHRPPSSANNTRPFSIASTLAALSTPLQRPSLVTDGYVLPGEVLADHLSSFTPDPLHVISRDLTCLDQLLAYDDVTMNGDVTRSLPNGDVISLPNNEEDVTVTDIPSTSLPLFEEGICVTEPVSSNSIRSSPRTEPCTCDLPHPSRPPDTIMMPSSLVQSLADLSLNLGLPTVNQNEHQQQPHDLSSQLILANPPSSRPFTSSSSELSSHDSRPHSRRKNSTDAGVQTNLYPFGDSHEDALPPLHPYHDSALPIEQIRRPSIDDLNGRRTGVVIPVAVAAHRRPSLEHTAALNLDTQTPDAIIVRRSSRDSTTDMPTVVSAFRRQSGDNTTAAEENIEMPFMARRLSRDSGVLEMQQSVVTTAGGGRRTSQHDNFTSLDVPTEVTAFRRLSWDSAAVLEMQQSVVATGGGRRASQQDNYMSSDGSTEGTVFRRLSRDGRIDVLSAGTSLSQEHLGIQTAESRRPSRESVSNLELSGVTGTIRRSSIPNVVGRKGSVADGGVEGNAFLPKRRLSQMAAEAAAFTKRHHHLQVSFKGTREEILGEDTQEVQEGSLISPGMVSQASWSDSERSAPNTPKIVSANEFFTATYRLRRFFKKMFKERAVRLSVRQVL